MRVRCLMPAALCCIWAFLYSGGLAAASQGCPPPTTAASATSQDGLAGIPKDLLLSIEVIKSADGGRCAPVAASPKVARCFFDCKSARSGNNLCITCCSCCFFDVGDPICECTTDCTPVF